jgi:chromosome partitioning protein
MRTISILNFKGGTGKTSLATNLGHALALKGSKVLLVDCDLQRNASSIITDLDPPTFTQVLRSEAAFTDAIRSARENLDVLPADNNLNEAAQHISASGAGGYKIVEKAVRRLSGYDYVLFDHSPSYSPVTETVLLGSSEMLIPCELAPYAVTGLLDMINKLTAIFDRNDHEVTITGIVPFKLDQRYTMTERYLASLKKRFEALVIHPVRTDATISRAQSLGQTVFEYDPKSKAAEDFTEIAAFVMQAEGVRV